jgi:flagellar hook protein FlgE
MSLYGAMFSGVSGLNANSQALGAIADNITNVNTVGYKSTNIRFQTLVTAQSSGTGYSPGGVQVNPFSGVEVQGLFQSSSNTTDLAIAGDGFFVVNEENVGNGASGYNFTRAGAFSADKSGYLKNTAGHYLQGYATNGTGQPIDAAGVVFNPDPTVFTNLETIRLNNIGGSADATGALTFGANLNAEDAIGATSNTTIQVYDSLGVSHNLQMVWSKAASNAWDLAIEPPKGGATAKLVDAAGDYYASTGRIDFATAPADGDTITVTTGGTAAIYEFDTNGAVTVGNLNVVFTAGEKTGACAALIARLNGQDGGVASARFTPGATDTSRIDIKQTATGEGDIIADYTLTSGINQSGTGGAVTINALTLAPATTSAITFSGTGLPAAPGFKVDDIIVDLNNGANDLSVDFNFGTVGMADGLTQFAADYSPTFIDTDGAAFGQFSGVTISDTGMVTALFANGDMRPIFKIPIATFPNANGLGASSGNVYNQTDYSGLIFMRTAGQGGAGKVQSSVLESSTVDIAKEFTTMITTQRAYSASAKIISTANEMLEELMRVKR